VPLCDGRMISASVAPLARFIIAITSAFLLARSALGLVTGFLARPAFFAGLALLAVTRFVFAPRHLRRRCVLFRFGYVHSFLLTWLRS
jgi:hypothetical protein